MMVDDKPKIDLTNWLNSVTNFPEMWNQLIDEALTNRYGIFTYHYEDSRNFERDGELIYSKPFQIDLTITIDKTVQDEEAEKAYKISEEKQAKFNKLHEVMTLFNDSVCSDEELNIDELINNLEKIKKN